jgi:hypothetical protein
VRMYSRTNATAIDDPEFGHFAVSAEHGGFELPDPLADRLHSFHHRGKPAWETEIERDERLHGEDSARRRDPQTLYNAVEGIGTLMERLAAVLPASIPAAANEDVAELTAEVAKLRAQLAEAQGTAEPDAENEAGTDGGADPAKETRTRKPAA